MSLVFSPAELANYRALQQKVDRLCETITGAFAGQIRCRAGCSGCCRELTLFAVEAAALLAAMDGLSADRAALLADAPAPGTGACPLLANGICLLYADRPLICRTHGLPVLTREAGAPRIDFCPENFRETDTLPGTAVIDLDLLNQALVAVNAHFVATTGAPQLRSDARLSITALITLWKGLHDDPA